MHVSQWNWDFKSNLSLTKTNYKNGWTQKLSLKQTQCGPSILFHIRIISASSSRTKTLLCVHIMRHKNLQKCNILPCILDLYLATYQRIRFLYLKYKFILQFYHRSLKTIERNVNIHLDALQHKWCVQPAHIKVFTSRTLKQRNLPDYLPMNHKLNIPGL